MEIGLVVFLVLSTLIVFGFIATMRWLDIWKQQRLGGEGVAEGENSLGTGELRGLIQEAMQDVIAPLEERLDLMEGHLRQLPAHEDATRELRAHAPDESDV